MADEDYENIRKNNDYVTQKVCAWLATLSAEERAAHDQAEQLFGKLCCSPSFNSTRAKVDGCSWDAHTVRHRLGAADPERWLMATLTQERLGQSSVCLYACPEDEAELDEWEETLPLDDYGWRTFTTAGVLALAREYDVGAEDDIPAFFCEECVCLCGKQTQEPNGVYCVQCSIDGPTHEYLCIKD